MSNKELLHKLCLNEARFPSARKHRLRRPHQETAGVKLPSRLLKHLARFAAHSYCGSEWSQRNGCRVESSSLSMTFFDVLSFSLSWKTRLPACRMKYLGMIWMLSFFVCLLSEEIISLPSRVLFLCTSLFNLTFWTWKHELFSSIIQIFWSFAWNKPGV